MSYTLFIDGEHGTTGLQIRKRLASRTDLRILSLPQEERHNLSRRTECLLAADFVILCLPDEAARDAVALLKAKPDTKIIDTSTQHRTNPDWVYGFKELTKDQGQKIKKSSYVSNPGCYATGAISLIRPLRDKNFLKADSLLTINAISGYTGGGKQLIHKMEDKHCEGAISSAYFSYSLGLKHKHLPEIQTYGRLSIPPLFLPSVGRFPQGMLVNIPVHFQQLENITSGQQLREAFLEHYRDQPHITVASEEETMEMERLDPTMLAHTDMLKIFIFANDKMQMVNFCAVLDNLGKGAAGAAVQNLNLMLTN